MIGKFIYVICLVFIGVFFMITPFHSQTDYANKSAERRKKCMVFYNVNMNSCVVLVQVAEAYPRGAAK